MVGVIYMYVDMVFVGWGWGGGGCVGIFFCICWFVLFFVNSLVGCLNMIGDLMF